MSSKMFLVLDLNGTIKFDPQRIRECLSALDGVHDWSDDTADALFECQFDFAGDNTIVLVPKELDSVSVWGMGDASLRVALEIQRCYDTDIHALNDSFTMDIVLSEVNSVDEFKQRIEGEWGQSAVSR